MRKQLSKELTANAAFEQWTKKKKKQKEDDKFDGGGRNSAEKHSGCVCVWLGSVVSGLARLAQDVECQLCENGRRILGETTRRQRVQQVF